jgi:two-component system chemotaxis response regulator CheB
MSTNRIRVLVVDDSAVVRKLISEALSSDAEIEVVGTAVDPYAARDQIIALAPDVLTLDLEMPRMDGLTFLRILMEQRPIRVVVLSSLTRAGSDQALEALRLGAVDVLGKPGGAFSFGDLGPQLIAKVKAAAVARLNPLSAGKGVPPVASAARISGSGGTNPSLQRTAADGSRNLILLGASTGGTEALRDVLTRLPGNLPPIAIVQHIPAIFSKAFADRLDQLCAFRVHEAKDGDLLEPGHAFIAPGNFHMLLTRQGGQYRVRVIDGPPVWHQRPAVDMLFKSAVEAGVGGQVVAGVLTGMGKDGAEGLLRLRERGAATFAQDEATCVVYGMPRAAWENGAAQRQVPLQRVPEYICRQLEPAVAGPATAARISS